VCSVEVRAHVLLLALVVAPITLIVLPSVLCAPGGYAVGQAAASGGPLRILAVLGDVGWLSLSLGAGTLVTVLATSVGVVAYRRSLRADDETTTKPPTGPKGAMLIDVARHLWERVGGASDRSPEVVWSANFNVLAHADAGPGRRRIRVSSGLWERVTRGDGIAETILTHEIAHLVHRDPTAFRGLAAVAAARRAVLRATLGTALAALLLLLWHVVATGLAAAAPVARIAARGAATVSVVGLILAIVPLGAAALGRYAGFIASLIEMRADVAAALWTGGLDRFARMLAEDPTVRRSSFRDRRLSVLSLHLTHISETERQELLGRPDRLITPKLRYFALSLALALLLPINAMTPLLAGGALDHLLMLGPVAVLHVVTIAMLARSGDLSPLPWVRAFTVAAALCVTLALPRVNFGSVGYLLTHEAVSIAETRGFGVDPLSVARVREDVGITVVGLLRATVRAVGSGWLLVAIAVTAAALKGVTLRSRRIVATPRTEAIVLASAAIAALLAVALSGYDEWRAAFYVGGAASAAEWWFARTEDFVWIRLAAPALTALAVICVATVRLPPGTASRDHRVISRMR